MTRSPFKSKRIDCWCRVELADGFTGIVVDINRSRKRRSGLKGYYYRVVGSKIRCVARTEIVRKINTQHPQKEIT